MDNPGIGSLNSLADYGLGSDIEDSDEEVENKDSQVKPIAVARPYVAQTRVTSSKCTSIMCGKGFNFVSLWRGRSKEDLDQGVHRCIFTRLHITSMYTYMKALIKL